ncbi:DIS3 mitotic control homolog [Seminavis robusta]|uniref:DIS3 mitotic control homolog n=1 Tax=Seminavis robusta TaxID=568900 RepID=A0A9N8E0N2_9STRA|nr:DIS3 mitotic control homolog [Seminavis robusta]|eukprot:Sro443_g144180.1 DIS3 mitotic control homolog (S (206) ;mRNA; r:60807-61572
MMSSVLLKSLAKRPLSIPSAKGSFPAAAVSSSLDNTIQKYCHYHTDTNSQSSDDRIFPVYVHHVSKVVLKHLQDSRSNWLVEQGLDKGLHVNSNGTFMLTFPPTEKGSGGKLWTSYDAATRQHWLSVYRQKFNARFLLKQSTCKMTGAQKMRNIQKTIQDHQTVEDQIRLVVDQMVRLVPPHIIATKEENQATTETATTNADQAS